MRPSYIAICGCCLADSSRFRYLGERPLFIQNDSGENIRIYNCVFVCSQCSSIIADINEVTLNAHFLTTSWTDPKGEGLTEKANRKQWFQMMVREITKLNTLPGKKILDWGCAYGHFCEMAQLEGWYPIGVENCDRVRQYASLNYPGIPFKKTMESIERNSLDAAVFIDSLYYSVDPNSILRELNYKLKMGAVVLVRVTNRVWYTYYKAIFTRNKRFQRSPIGDATYGFSKKGLTTMFNMNGFQLERFTYYERNKDVKNKASKVKILYRYISLLADYTGGLLPSAGMIAFFRKVSAPENNNPT